MKEFVDEETGIRITVEPSIHGSDHITAYPPEDGRDLSEEQVNEAVHRLMELVKSDETLRSL